MLTIHGLITIIIIENINIMVRLGRLGVKDKSKSVFKKKKKIKKKKKKISIYFLKLP
jgi:hypothetical protein